MTWSLDWPARTVRHQCDATYWAEIPVEEAAAHGCRGQGGTGCGASLPLWLATLLTFTRWFNTP